MIIQHLDGTQIDIAQHSLKRLYHHIPSLTMQHDTVNVDGRHGLIFLGSTYGERQITVELLYEAYDIYDYYLIRDEVNALFTNQQEYYIIFKNEPYKRYKVKLASDFEVPPHERMGAFEVVFTCTEVFAEAIATTTDIKEWDIDKWVWNGAITWDDDLKYNFNTNTFTVKNLGNVTIDPRQHELEIILKGTFSNSLTITNNTTGDVYIYNGALASNDELRLKGIQTFKNGVSTFKNTNKKLITLAPKENSFTITGGTINSVVFNFRFLYK